MRTGKRILVIESANDRVGKITLTTEQAKSSTGSRDRTLKVEKLN